MERKYSVVSLFSGGMGLDLGLDRTGRFRLLSCVEKQPAFAQTILTNKVEGRLPEDLVLFDRDIRDLDPQKILDACGLKPGELDVLVGGPPCQSFSTAGRRGTVQDPRGTLLWEFLRFVEVLQPRVFLMENVRGLLSAAIRHRPLAIRPDKGGPPLEWDEEAGSVMRLLSEDLLKLGDGSYRMDGFVVNAVNYGAPQLRERVLLFGNRLGQTVQFPAPTHGPANSVTSGLLPWATLGDALRNLDDPTPEVLDFSARKKKYLAMVPPGGNWRSLPERVQIESMGRAWHAKGGRSGWWRRLDYDLPTPTLVTLPNHASTSLCHPEEIRALSVLEYAAIQEFPAEWKLEGTLAEKYTQIGNAVPVRLGVVAGEVVSSMLDNLATGSSACAAGSQPLTVTYVHGHVRRRRYFRNGEAHVRTQGEKPRDSYDSVVASSRILMTASGAARPVRELPA